MTLSGAIGLGSAYYGEGTGFIFLDEVDCDVNATGILQCLAGDVIGIQNCVHGQDASVVCGGEWLYLCRHPVCGGE